MWLLLLLPACAPEEAGPTEAEPTLDCAPATVEDVLTRRGDYYRCLDDAAGGCGADGYPLGYGAKYADRYFDETWGTLSPDGQVFLAAVAVCLQASMDAWWTPDATCDALWDHGFATHPDCYLNAGFCDLPPTDMLLIAAAVDPEDQALPEAEAQTAAILAGCSDAP